VLKDANGDLIRALTSVADVARTFTVREASCKRLALHSN
jgi:hypothetical protein